MSNGSEKAASHAARVAGIIRERGVTHGDAIRQHETLAASWSKYLSRRLGIDVALRGSDATYMLLLMKDSRVVTAGLKEEHVEDIMGYAALTMAALQHEQESGQHRRHLQEQVDRALAEEPGAVRWSTEEEIRAGGPFILRDTPERPKRLRPSDEELEMLRMTLSEKKEPRNG